MPTEWTPQFEQVLREHLPLLEADQHLLPEAQLTALGLDSLATVQLLIGLEDALETTIPDAMLTPENFATPGALWAAMTSLATPQS
ncbi:phosphopantetheine-binding protein [Kitasatospora sp. NPDC052868]|uniref:phosphopantetheine-binding protein n=1 Tax=Kitasatospora sp. NPDC052868 TaxID=3364060 RepID=UPI0037C6A093